MRRGWKIGTVVVGLAALAVIWFLARQNLLLHEQIDALAIKSEGLAEGLDRLGREKGDSTARVLDQVIRAKSEPDTLELARLRAEVARLTKLVEEQKLQILTSSRQNLGRETNATLADIPIVPPGHLTFEQLSVSQRLAFQHLENELSLGTSINDIDRLKDTLARWDEAWVKDAPEDMKPVFTLLKEKLQERIAALEKVKVESEKEQPK